jgi:Bifunctional DNA primase/polymerase, N-terminal
MSTHDDTKMLAMNLARNCLYAVHPVKDDKTPASPHGCKDASTDPDQIGRLWQRWPAPLIGVATGAASGVSVLDLDLKYPSSVRWWRAHCERLPRTLTYRTRSGGLHLYFADPEGSIRNRQTKKGDTSPLAGVETRGTGGYVLHWFAAGFPCLDASPPAPWPSWLAEMLFPARRTPDPAQAVQPASRGRLDPLLRQVESATEGSRNSVLYWAANRCVDERHTDDATQAALVAAAVRAGLHENDARKTVASAMRRAAA